MDADGIEFELVAASLKADSADVAAFLPALAVKLEGALPGRCSVRYRGGFLGKKALQSIEVDLGETRFHVEDERGRLITSRQRAVRGIVLKNEVIPLESWIDELSRCVTEEARKSEHGRSALQTMLEGS